MIVGATWEEVIPGCTDLYAENYNENAKFDDESCSGYPENGEYSLSFGNDAAQVIVNPSPIFDFSGKTQLQVIGSPFQIKVWEALFQIQAGQVVTYSEVATAINKPSSVRAVATAIGRNPISFLIPCHRVIQKSGGLGGYHWGLPIKKHILNFENEKSRNPIG